MTSAPPTVKPSPATTPEITVLPVDKLRPSELNPRFDVGDVSGLAESITSLGILVPLLVTPRSKHYLLIAGHRRLAAAKSLGLTEVPCIIREAEELERLKLMLVENHQRVLLSPVEEGVAYARILQQHKITQSKLAEDIGVSQTHVSKRLAILRLPKHAIGQIHRGELSVSDALGYGARDKAYREAKPYRPRPSSCSMEGHANHKAVTCEIAHAVRGAA